MLSQTHLFEYTLQKIDPSLHFRLSIGPLASVWGNLELSNYFHTSLHT